MPKTSKKPVTGHAAHKAYGVIVWKGAADTPSRYGFDTPLEALITGIKYLRDGYQVRLTNATCEALDGIAVPGLDTAPVRNGVARPAGSLGGVPVAERLRAAAVPPPVFQAPPALVDASA